MEGQELINYRIDRAKSSLQEARLLKENKFYHAAANRLYYACFYVVNVLFLKYNFLTSKHSGVRSIFNQKFVKPGIISSESGKLFNELFIFRQEADYRDFIVISKMKSIRP